MQSVLQCCGFYKCAQFIVVLSLLKLYFSLPPFHALSSSLVRRFHVLHFQSTRSTPGRALPGYYLDG